MSSQGREKGTKNRREVFVHINQWRVQWAVLHLIIGLSSSKKIQEARTAYMRKLSKVMENAKECQVEVEMGRLERDGVRLNALLGNVAKGKSQIRYDRKKRSKVNYYRGSKGDGTEKYARSCQMRR